MNEVYFDAILCYIPPYEPIVKIVGVLIVPSILVVRLVTRALDEPMENSYNEGEPANRLFRSMPAMVVVP